MPNHYVFEGLTDMEKAKKFFEETNKGFQVAGYDPLTWEQIPEFSRNMWLARMRKYEENKK